MRIIGRCLYLELDWTDGVLPRGLPLSLLDLDWTEFFLVARYWEIDSLDLGEWTSFCFLERVGKISPRSLLSSFSIRSA